MNVQEIKDKINNRLQDGTGWALATEDEFGVAACRYRTSNGLECSVGCLISDFYSSRMEGSSMQDLSISNKVWEAAALTASVIVLADVLNKAGIPATPEVQELLVTAQRNHDNHHNWNGNKYIGPLL